MTVGIFGWFHTGNYGDELMAIYVAKALREIGVSPLVFSARAELAQQHGLRTTDDLDAFFAEIAFCVFAEGGCLVDAGDSGNEKRGRYDSLSAAALQHGKIVYPFSIGGNGTGAGARPKGGLGQLWHRGVFGETIVRLEGDLALVDSFGATKATQLPDMLWEAADFLLGEGLAQRAPKADRPLRIGVNFLRRLVPEDFEEWVGENTPEGVEVHWLAVHTESRVKGELRADRETDRVKVFRHQDPLQLLRFVGTLDLLVSSKLHVGLTALSQGTTFLSCHGRPKTHAQLRELEPALVRDEDAKALLEHVFRDGPESLGVSFPGRAIENLKTGAAENRAQLARWVERRR